MLEHVNCKRCGRKLRNSISRNRGYGGTCFSKINKDEARHEQLKVDMDEENNDLLITKIA